MATLTDTAFGSLSYLQQGVTSVALPTLSGVTVGKSVTIVNASGSSVTITPDGTDTINNFGTSVSSLTLAFRATIRLACSAGGVWAVAKLRRGAAGALNLTTRYASPAVGIGFLRIRSASVNDDIYSGSTIGTTAFFKGNGTAVFPNFPVASAVQGYAYDRADINIYYQFYWNSSSNPTTLTIKKYDAVAGTITTSTLTPNWGGNVPTLNNFGYAVYGSALLVYPQSIFLFQSLLINLNTGEFIRNNDLSSSMRANNGKLYIVAKQNSNIYSIAYPVTAAGTLTTISITGVGATPSISFYEGASSAVSLLARNRDDNSSYYIYDVSSGSTSYAGTKLQTVYPNLPADISTYFNFVKISFDPRPRLFASGTSGVGSGNRRFISAPINADGTLSSSYQIFTLNIPLSNNLESEITNGAGNNDTIVLSQIIGDAAFQYTLADAV